MYITYYMHAGSVSTYTVHFSIQTIGGVGGVHILEVYIHYLSHEYTFLEKL